MRKLLLVLIALLAVVTFVRTANQSLEANERSASLSENMQTVHINSESAVVDQQSAVSKN